MYEYLKRFSVPYIYFYEGGPNSIAKLYWGGHGQIAPPGSATDLDACLISSYFACHNASNNVKTKSCSTPQMRGKAENSIITARN